MPLEPFAITTFCDDIRYEIGGKHTLVGIYRDDMAFIGSFPLTVPRLGISITYVEHPSVPIGDFDVFVYVPGDRPDEPTYRARIEPPKIDPTPDAADDKRRLLNFHFLLGPFTLKEEGRIKVRLMTKGQRIKAGTLFVHAKPEPPPNS